MISVKCVCVRVFTPRRTVSTYDKAGFQVTEKESFLLEIAEFVRFSNFRAVKYGPGQRVFQQNHCDMFFLDVLHSRILFSQRLKTRKKYSQKCPK
jgi:hypothetical protein